VNFTAVTTVFNDENEIISLIKNLESQKLKPIEIIIVDGGSKDTTIQKVLEYSNKSIIKISCYYGTRLNISQGFNYGIKKACTEFISIVAVGNKYSDDYFYLLAEAIVKDDLDYAFSPFYGVNSTKFASLYNMVFLNKNKGMILNIASNHGVLIKKDVIVKTGYFYENFVYAGEDLELYEKIRNYGFRGKIVLNAKVYWDTPHTFKDFCKQVRMYTIAKMQIYKLSNILLKNKKNNIYVITILFTVLFLLVKSTRVEGLILLLAIIIYNIAKWWKYGINFILLKNLAILLPYYYILKDHKYLAPKYKVQDNKRIK